MEGKGAQSDAQSAAVSFLTFNYDIRSCQVAVLLLGSDNPEGEGEKPGEEGEKYKIKAETREAKSINVSRRVHLLSATL